MDVRTTTGVPAEALGPWISVKLAWGGQPQAWGQAVGTCGEVPPFAAFLPSGGEPPAGPSRP